MLPILPNVCCIVLWLFILVLFLFLFTMVLLLLVWCLACSYRSLSLLSLTMRWTSYKARSLTLFILLLFSMGCIFYFSICLYYTVSDCSPYFPSKSTSFSTCIFYSLYYCMLSVLCCCSVSILSDYIWVVGSLGTGLAYEDWTGCSVGCY